MRFGKNRLSKTVSIHAPVKGATLIGQPYAINQAVSIHAPVKGATRFRRDFRRGTLVSIHAPVKGATAKAPLSRAVISVSIHAPVKGATVILCVFNREIIKRFNSRTRKGCDFTGVCVIYSFTPFQFTHP